MLHIHIHTQRAFLHQLWYSNFLVSQKNYLGKYNLYFLAWTTWVGAMAVGRYPTLKNLFSTYLSFTINELYIMWQT